MYNLSKKKIIIFLLFIITTFVLIFVLNKDSNIFLKKIDSESVNTNVASRDSLILNSSSSIQVGTETVATTTTITALATTTKISTTTSIKVEAKQAIVKKIIPSTTSNKVVVTNKISTNPIKEDIRVIETKPISTTTSITSNYTICNQASGGFAGQVENEINSVRTSYGLSKLIVCKELRNSSYQKYLDIVAQNNFTHEWAGGKKLYDVIVSNGYVPKKWGEILEYGSDFTTAREHVDNWMSSPAHKSIILSPEYTHFGVYVGGWNVEGTPVDMGTAHFGKK